MINIISSNIRFDNKDDKENAWSNRKQFLSTTLLDYVPDIIGSQEGRLEQLSELKALLRYKLLDENREWIKHRMYPCLFAKKGMRVIDSGDFWLSKTPMIPGSSSFKSAFPRLCTWGLFFKTDLFYIFNVHLDHVRSSTRAEQARVLRNLIRKINHKNRPFILMGDFNTGPKTEVYNFLSTSMNLRDAWTEAGLSEESSYHRFLGSYKEGKRIDWILYSPHFKVKYVKMLKERRRNLYLSDHFPLFCQLVFK